MVPCLHGGVAGLHIQQHDVNMEHPGAGVSPESDMVTASGGGSDGDPKFVQRGGCEHHQVPGVLIYTLAVDVRHRFQNNGTSALYQLVAIFTEPASLACTPSTESVAILKFVN